jgi:hypothetical protein
MKIIKKCNYMTGDVTDIGYSVSRIVKLLDISGRNYLLITKSTATTSLPLYLSNNRTFNSFNDFKTLISNKSVLFRVDLIIFDFWHLSKDLIVLYKKEIDKLDIDHIIVAEEYYYNSTEDISDYLLKRESKYGFSSQIIIHDKINKWTSTLDYLVKSYIRDKKIDSLFGK